MDKTNIILASGSLYRKWLLEKLQLPFIVASSDIDESAMKDETPAAMAIRLAEHKALALQHRYDNHIIIASDQVAILENQQLTKPGNADNTIRQLQACSGKPVEFYTSVSVLNSHNGKQITALDKTVVYFKQLSDAQIKSYVARDRPYDCAGGFKVESLGIILFDGIDCSDPNALIGLPLIKLINILEQFDVQIL